METITAALLNFGIGGAMLGAFLWFAWHVMTKLIPAIIQSRENDLVSFRQDLQQEREKFLEFVDNKDKRFIVALGKLSEQHESILDNICNRLEQIETALKR